MISQLKYKAIVIGASAGAVEALSKMLPELPEEFPLPIIVVVHVPPDKKSILPELLRDSSKVNVKEVEDKESIAPGTVYFAPPDYHVLVEEDLSLSLAADEPVNFSRPAIDVLFESAADALGASVVGLILTGGSNDGARGLAAIDQAGGLVMVQDPKNSAVPNMPLAALELCPNAHRLRVDQIAPFFVDLGRVVQ